MATVVEKSVETKTSAPVADGPRRFTVEEYNLMGETGIIKPDERVELIEGEIIKMSPKGTAHCASTSYAEECLRAKLGDRALVRTQDPIHLDEHSEPEPDVVLAMPHPKRYADHHPTPEEILYVMEIADTTLAKDRTIKARVYAQAGIIQYGILNVNARELEDYRDPDASGYRTKHTYRADESFTLVAFPEVHITVSELLPPE
jgi:Uma2 family endonuclease